MKLTKIAYSIALASLASSATLNTAAAADEHTVTGNVSIVSDYRFRGISQTFRAPALQGGIDYAHSSGLYLGNWNSNVSGVQYVGGAGLEMDFYGGWKGEVSPGLTLDVGGLVYYYPGANYKHAGGTAPDEEYTNQELYLGLGYGPVTGKLYYAVSDYFGLSKKTGGQDSSGTMYLDLSYSQVVADKLTLGVHVGYTKYKNYSDYNYTDYKVGLTYDLAGWMLGANVVGNSVKTAGEGFYTATNGSGEVKKLFKPALVLSVGKSF